MSRTKDQDKTREQLISELTDLRRQVTNLEASVVAHERREETLRRTEAEWRSLVENAPAKITTLDCDGTILFVNSTSPDRTTEEVVGTSIYNYVLPDEQDEIKQVLESVFQSGLAKKYETVVVRADGTEVVFSNNVAPIKHKSQTIAAVFITTDITKYKQAEEALRESEEKFRYLFQNANEGITVTQDEVVIFANPKALELLGCSRDELSVTNVFEFIHPEDQNMVADRYRRRLTGGIVSPVYECRIIDKTGKTRWVENRVVELAWDGRPAYLGFFADITDRKLAEERIRASLREKEVMLREIHHRVRNNLAVISSLLDFQARYTQDEQAQEALHESRSRVHSMALVHAQLYRTPDLAQIDFAVYVQTLTENLFAACQVVSGGASLQLDISDVPLEVDQAIPCGLIITELVTNALKHAFPVNRKDDGAEENEIRVVFHPTAEGEYELVVSDNGVGLPPGFEFPSRDTLGLFLISAYVRELKGTVEWHTDEGTTCRILFTPVNLSKLLQDND
jgi:PAS domain S-box-containing protein